MSLLLPKPKPKGKKIRKPNKAFQELIVGLDCRCMNPFCDGSKLGLWAHHILLKSGGRYDEAWNGITFCAICHDFPHGRGNHRKSGDEWMLTVLNWYLGQPKDRWVKVRGILRQRVERKRNEVFGRYRSK